MAANASSLDLAGRVAVVVGASSGIGREGARELTSILGRAVNVSGIDVQDIVLRSPGGPMVAPISPRFGVGETTSQEA